MKNGLSEIIKSGCAPGISTGAPALDPDSVYVKAPKGLAAIENEPKWKNGPTRSAKDISRYMGMSSDFIRKTWSKPVLVALLCVCAASLKAGDLTPGQNFTDGQTVSATQLNGLVGNATVNNSLISGKPVDPAILGSDTMLIYSPTLNGLYRATFNSSFLQNPALITAQSEKTVPISGDYLLLWDSVGLTLTKVSAANLVLNNTNFISGQPFIQASNLDLQFRMPLLNYGTNAQTTFSNALTALEYTRALTNLTARTAPTNNDELLIWDSVSGTMKQTSLMGLLTNLTTVPSVTHFDSMLVAATGANAFGTNPVVSRVVISNLVPVTAIYDNLTLTNSYMVYTAKPFGGVGHVEVKAVLVTLSQGVASSYNIGDEIPVDRVLNSGDLTAFSYGVNATNVWFSGRYSGNYTGVGDLFFPTREGGNSSTLVNANHTNFTARLYVTFYPSIP